MLVAPLYDRLLGMTLGLTHVDRDSSSVAADCDAYLQSWATCVLRLCRQLYDQPEQHWDKSQERLILEVVNDHWSHPERSSLERVFALSLGVFCWCDRDEALVVWREALSADCPLETHLGIELFTVVLRSFLREPPGRTVWLPLKRPTTIADLKACSPGALAELKCTKHAMSRKTSDVFLTSTAIACQLPWYSSACKLARRQPYPIEAQVIISALLGAAFGPIAFQEDVRAYKQMNANRQRIAAAINPLWQALMGIGTGAEGTRPAQTLSLARSLG